MPKGLAVSEFTLDLLGPIILGMRDDVRDIQERLARMEERVEAHRDDFSVAGVWLYGPRAG